MCVCAYGVGVTSLLVKAAVPDLLPFFPSAEEDELAPSEGLPGRHNTPLIFLVTGAPVSLGRCLFRIIITMTTVATAATSTTPTRLPTIVEVRGCVLPPPPGAAAEQ